MTLTKVYSILYIILIMVSFFIYIIKAYILMFPNLSYLVSLLIIFIFSFYIFNYIKIKKIFVKILFYMLLILIYAIASILWSIDKERTILYSFVQLIIVMSTFVIPLLLIQSNLIFQKLNYQYFLKIINYLVILYLLISWFLFYITYGNDFSVRFGGLYNNANIVGNIIFIFLLSLRVYGTYFKTKYLMYCIVLIMLIMTQSRNLLIGYFIFESIYFYLKGNKKQLILILITLLPIIIVLNTIRMSNYERDYGTSQDDISGKVITRPLIWLSAYNFVHTHNMIVLGSGYETDKKVIKNTIVGKLWVKQTNNNDATSSVHSSVFKYFITGGIIGLLLFILLIYSLIQFFHKYSKEYITLKSLGIAFVIAPVVTDIFNVNFWGAFGLPTTLYFVYLLFLMHIVYFNKKGHI